MATINNVDHSWSMIEITSSNTALQAVAPYISSIKWNIKRNVKVNYGLKGKPVGRGFGNTEHTASIVLNENGLQHLRAACGGDLIKLGEFDLIVSWVDDMGITDLPVMHTTTLKGCFFNEDGLDANQDSTELTKELDLNPFTIEHVLVS